VCLSSCPGHKTHIKTVKLTLKCTVQMLCGMTAVQMLCGMKAVHILCGTTAVQMMCGMTAVQMMCGMTVYMLCGMTGMTHLKIFHQRKKFITSNSFGKRLLIVTVTIFKDFKKYLSYDRFDMLLTL